MNTPKILLSCIGVLIFLTQVVIGQTHESKVTITFEELQQKTFGKLDKEKLYDGILINSSIWQVDLEEYASKNEKEPLTLDYITWGKMYYKIYTSYLGTPKIPDARDVFNKVEEYNKQELIPLGISHFKYSEISADAVDKGLLHVDKDFVLWDKSTGRDSPYEIKESMICAALRWLPLDVGEVTFVLSKDFIFDNTGSEILQISIDFDDGAGFRKMRVGETVDIDYRSEGLKTITMRIAIGKEMFTVKSTLQVGEQQTSILKSGSSGGDDFGTNRYPDFPRDIYATYNGSQIGGSWGVYYGCGEAIIDKPIIVVEGFDPMNNKELVHHKDKKNLYAINDTKAHILDKLLEMGYDVIILDFHNNPIDLQANGHVVAALVEHINNIKVGNNELIVMGRSGGGLLARYALALMEATNRPHQTRMLLTIDAPHQGANIPLGLQHFIDEIVSSEGLALLGPFGIIIETFLLNTTLNSMYAQQMLYYHHYQSSGNNAHPSIEKLKFFTALNNYNGGYPSKLLKVAMASGDKRGTNQGFGFNANLLVLNHSNIPACPTMQVVSTVKALPQQNTSGSIFSFQLQARPALPPPLLCVAPWATVTFKNFNVSNALPYDNAPGGNAGWHRLNIDPFMPDVLNEWGTFLTGISVEPNFTCFVPTISALDLKSTILPSTNGGLFYDVNSNLANNTNVVKVGNVFYNLAAPAVSPFDILYVAYENQGHGESNGEWNALFDNAVTPINYNLQNQQITSKRTYYARNQIKAGNNVTNTIPQGNFVVKSGSNVTLTAGNSIILSAGFKAEAGSIFKATTHTETNCQLKSATVEEFDDYEEIALEFPDDLSYSLFDIIVSTEKEVTVFPNPAETNIVVSFNRHAETAIEIEIYDIEGAIVYSTKSANRLTEINVSDYKAGNYIIKITTNNQVFTEKFVKL